MSEAPTSETNSRGQILKSTAIFGSAQVIIVLVGIIRTKILAVLLGPIGVGISGLYQSALDLIKTTSSLGLGYSGVRNIAEASASGDTKRVSVVILVLKRWSWLTGFVGVLVTIVFSRQISRVTFGDTSHAVGFSLLSVTLLLSALATSKSALLQGLRRISAMAKSVVFTALAGLVSSSVIYYFLGIKGIVPAIIVVAAIELMVTWFYSKKIPVDKVSFSMAKSIAEGKAMVKLGFFMTVSVLAGTASMYFVRAFVVHHGGLNTAGCFIAAWTISSLYISAVFNAMGADFFPRLSGVQHNRTAIKKMVNDQTEAALLLTIPVIIIMISFIDWLVPLFYSAAFDKTARILSWQLAGDFFKVLSWPLGFILLAKGKGMMFLITEVVWNILFCSFSYFGWFLFGIEVTGIAFLMAYFIYMAILYVTVNRVLQFQWTRRVWKTICFFFPLLLLSFLSARFLSGGTKFFLGSILSLIAVVYSYIQLQNLVAFKKILNYARLKNVL